MRLVYAAGLLVAFDGSLGFNGVSYPFLHRWFAPIRGIRSPARFAAIVGLSGGLIGPPGTSRAYAGSFAGTPAFLGCSDSDVHVPLERVLESADVLERMGSAVDRRIYPRMGHTVNRDEIRAVHALLIQASLDPTRR